MRGNRSRLQLCGVSTSKVHLAMKHTRTDLAKVGYEECQVFRDFPIHRLIQIRNFTLGHRQSLIREYLQRFQPAAGLPGSDSDGTNRLPAGSHRMGLLRINNNSFGRGTRICNLRTGGARRVVISTHDPCYAQTEIAIENAIAI